MDPTPSRLHELFGLAPPAGSYAGTNTTIDAREATVAERDAYIREILGLIRSDRVRRTESENRAAWERGWQQNLDEARARHFAPEALRPKYFRGNRFLRWRRGLVVSDNPQIEYELFVIARRILFGTFLAPAASIYELGCGSGNNLLLLSDMFPDKEIVGLDWVKPAIDLANEFGRETGRRVSGRLFDMATPDAGLRPGPSDAVISIHALEQLGDRHGALLDWLEAARPAVVLHYEPILEFYDPDNLLDYLALWYSERRDYLTGFWTEIVRRRDAGRIEILYSCRPELGGVYHEASVVVWRPVPQAGRAPNGG